MLFFFSSSRDPRDLHSFPTRRSSDLGPSDASTPSSHSAHSSSSMSLAYMSSEARIFFAFTNICFSPVDRPFSRSRSEEHTSELQSRQYLVCRLLLEKKKKKYISSSIS